MTILGLWAILAGYAVLYAGIANWQGSGISIPQAFTGQGQVKCAGKSGSQPTPPAGQGSAGGHTGHPRAASVRLRWV